MAKIYQINRYHDTPENKGKLYSVTLVPSDDLWVNLKFSPEELIAFRNNLDKVIKDMDNTSIIFWKGNGF